MGFPLIALPAAAATGIVKLVKAHPSIAGHTAGAMLYEGARTFPRVRRAKWSAASFRNGYKGPDVPL